jgi:hypothetical protein
MQVISNDGGKSYDFDQLAAAVLARYAEAKTPALVAKSALQLGIPEDVIVQLPDVTREALAQGHWLIDSGAFPPKATGTPADGTFATPLDLGSSQCQARLAAGLDPYGFPPQQVAMMRAAGTYIEPMTPDQVFVEQLWLHILNGSAVAAGFAQDYSITGDRFFVAVKTLPYILHPLVALLEGEVTAGQIWAYVEHAAPTIAVDVIGVPPPDGGASSPQ